MRPSTIADIRVFDGCFAVKGSFAVWLWTTRRAELLQCELRARELSDKKLVKSLNGIYELDPPSAFESYTIMKTYEPRSPATRLALQSSSPSDLRSGGALCQLVASRCLDHISTKAADPSDCITSLHCEPNLRALGDRTMLVLVLTQMFYKTDALSFHLSGNLEIWKLEV